MHPLQSALQAVATMCGGDAKQLDGVPMNGRIQYVEGSYAETIKAIGTLLTELGHVELVPGTMGRIVAGGEVRKLTPGIGGIDPGLGTTSKRNE